VREAFRGFFFCPRYVDDWCYANIGASQKAISPRDRRSWRYLVMERGLPSHSVEAASYTW
jgi:hypothetical protein